MDNVSSDFIFGTLATDTRRLGYLKAETSGVSHRHRLEPSDPLPGRPVTIRVTLGPAVTADNVSCYYTCDPIEPGGMRGMPDPGCQALAFTRVGSVWDTFLWGYAEEWAGELPAQPADTTVRYRIEAWSSFSDSSFWAGEIIGSTPGDGSVVGEVGPGDGYLREMGAEFGLTFVRRRRTFAFRVDTQAPPDWLRDALIYQIFIDRFSPGIGRSFAAPETPMGFYGGTLGGVCEQLDYIAGLGSTVLWLSPIFPSPSHHGYNATDYYTVEPRLGSGDDLRRLIDEAHGRGMKVLLDYTANHISDQHPIFQSVLHDPHSPYRDWFSFTRYPDQYVSFFGVPELPQLNSDHPEARRFMIEPALYWLGQGVDGFRLDYTIGPSHAFWVDFRAATRALRPDSVMIGEAVDTAEALGTYMGRLDGCLDFLLLQSIRRFFAFGEITASRFDSFLSRHLAAFDPGFVMPSFLDNHDMNRFLWIVHGDLRRLKLAALCQYSLPHPPVLYYGTEAGLSQQRDVRYSDGSGHPEESRLPMIWGGGQNSELLDYYRRLGQLRRGSGPVWRGTRKTVYLDDSRGHYAYSYCLGAEQILVVLNNGPAAGRIPLPEPGWVILLASDDAALGAASVALPAYGGVILRR